MLTKSLALGCALLLSAGCAATAKYPSPGNPHESERSHYDCGYSAERADSCFTLHLERRPATA